MVYPSGAEESTAAAAVTPPARGWLSTTTWPFNRVASRSANSRIEMSETEPAANGETMRIARLGNLPWARAGDSASTSDPNAANVMHVCRRESLGIAVISPFYACGAVAVWNSLRGTFAWACVGGKPRDRRPRAAGAGDHRGNSRCPGCTCDRAGGAPSWSYGNDRRRVFAPAACGRWRTRRHGEQAARHSPRARART